MSSLMLAAISSCLVRGFLQSMAEALLAGVVMVASPVGRLWLLHVRVETRHVHAERHLAKAGVANGKVFERSFLGGTACGGAKTRRANGLGERDRGRAP